MTKKQQAEAKQLETTRRALVLANKGSEFVVRGSWLSEFIGRVKEARFREVEFEITRLTEPTTTDYKVGDCISIPYRSEYIALEVVPEVTA